MGHQLSYAEQARPDGIAQAFLIAGDFLAGEPSCLILGDNLFYGGGLTPLLKRAAARTEGATVFAYRVSDPQRYGVVGSTTAVAQAVSRKSRRPELQLCGHRPVFLRWRSLRARVSPAAVGSGRIGDHRLNRVYLERGLLAVERMGRGIAWLDTGNPDALLQAANFVQIVEVRQGLKIACLEEVALNLGYIEIDQVLALAKPIANTEYGRYLLQLAHRQTDKHDVARCRRR